MTPRHTYNGRPGLTAEYLRRRDPSRSTPCVAPDVLAADLLERYGPGFCQHLVVELGAVVEELDR